MSQRAEWKSQTGFLLAALGSAIGLGNIWRFPYIAYRNGGGAFLVPYFVALCVVGIPLLMLEFGLGHKSRRAFPQSMRAVHPRFSWIGWWSVSFVMFGIVAYYGVVIAWCGNYLVFSVTQPWGDLAHVNSFFDETFLAAFEEGRPFPVYTRDTGFQFGHFNPWIVVSLAVIWGLNLLITRRELQHGIELANRLFIPILVGITLLLVVWSWSFEGASVGRELYLKPDWSRVFTTQTWIDAFSQIFFTLSLGFGIMAAYGSYLPRDADIPTCAFLTGVGNCLFSLVAGLAVFSAIGLLAEERGVELNRMAEIADRVTALEATQAAAGLSSQEQDELRDYRGRLADADSFQTQMTSFGLVFKTYPAIITRIGPVAGRVFGVLFFVSLVVAGLSSSISILEAFMSALTDQFGWNRRRMAPVLCGGGFLAGIIFCSQAGLFWLDLVDHFITTYGLVLVAIAEAIVVGWLFPIRRLRLHLAEHHAERFRCTISLAMRLLLSVVLLLTWYGLSRQPPTVATGIGRFLLLCSGIVLWIDEHWFDFNIRLVIPALLIFLLDQALMAEIATPYGGYPLPALLGIGLGWLLGTLGIAVGLSLIPVQSDPDD